MTAIPAKVAGVEEVILVTPPSKDGSIAPAILIAADIAGVSRIFSVGGAQAIAALAFGTESVPRVDKICGPGNIYVFLAKKLVYGVVELTDCKGLPKWWLSPMHPPTPITPLRIYWRRRARRFVFGDPDH